MVKLQSPFYRAGRAKAWLTHKKLPLIDTFSLKSAIGNRDVQIIDTSLEFLDS